MRRDDLLTQFDRISAAPAAVPSLRRLVFDLAIRGRLVAQLRKEPSATKLFDCIAAEKAALVSTGDLRDGKSLSPVDEPPFGVPESWRWVPLGETGRIFNGDSVSAAVKRELADVATGRPFIATKDVGYGRDPLEYDNGLRVAPDDSRFKVARAGAVLICAEGGSAGKKCGITDREISFGNKLFANELWTGIDPKYMLALYQAAFFYEQFSRRMTGIIGGISRRQLVALPVPVPPAAEQRRIVERVDELMAVCDRLDDAIAARDASQDSFLVSSLQRLNRSSSHAPANGHADAALYAQNLARVTTKPEHVEFARDAVLSLAVQGRLVTPDPHDEPARDLLDRVAREKDESGVNKTGRRWVANDEVVDEAFTAPEPWCWTRLGNAVERVTVGHVGPMKDKYVDVGVPFLRNQNVRPNRFRPEGLVAISREFHEALAKSALVPGDVVVVRSGNVGTACAIPESLPEANCADLVVVKNPLAVHPKYLCFYLNSLASVHVKAGTVGMALTHFNTKSVARMPLPVPPMGEQIRIVERVEQLLSLCDQLENDLARAEGESSRFLAAAIREVLDTPA